MKFIADNMLGTLAKWLRLFGYDTLYPKNAEDTLIIEIAQHEDWILLTRDKEIPKRKKYKDVKIVLITKDDLQDQIAEVLSTLGLKIDQKKILTRCSVCNTEIELVSKSEAQTKVPEGVFEQYNKFWKCPECGRFYWEGTHWKKIIDTARPYTV